MSKYVAKKPDKNGYVKFTEEENQIWKILYARQFDVIQNRACDEFISGLKTLNMPVDRVPQCEEISEVLRATTGWSVKPVNAIIPLEEFYSLLANKQFPAATFIRLREDLDYLQEPDIFHEFFGHCPMLTNQAYANFIQWYGENALVTDKKTQSILGRLFWFTIEFGLLKTTDGLRIYGGGILSSYQETLYALESAAPKRLEFDLATVLKTPYRYDQIQNAYFLLNNLDELFHLKYKPILTVVDEIMGGSEGNDFNVC
ncbi:MAG: phenylalanine 4-monooxygenase [Gammaproteobacteria bacterium]|nr:phenylalanine 4-monooxygenase [Gammaproteobacteria bacterium]